MSTETQDTDYWYSTLTTATHWLQQHTDSWNSPLTTDTAQWLLIQHTDYWYSTPTADTANWLLIQHTDYWYSTLTTDTAHWLLIQHTGYRNTLTPEMQHTDFWYITLTTATHNKHTEYCNIKHHIDQCNTQHNDSKPTTISPYEMQTSAYNWICWVTPSVKLGNMTDIHPAACQFVLFLRFLSVLYSILYIQIYKTDKIEEKQQTGINLPNFQLAPSLGVYSLHLNVGKITVHATILKRLGD